MSVILHEIEYNQRGCIDLCATGHHARLRREMEVLSEILGARSAHLVDGSGRSILSDPADGNVCQRSDTVTSRRGLKLPLGRRSYLFVEEGKQSLLSQHQVGVLKAKRRIQNLLHDIGSSVDVPWLGEGRRRHAGNKGQPGIIRSTRVLRDVLEEEIAAGRIQLYYQPKVSISNGRLAGFEALLRWVIAEDTVCTPDTFQEILLCRDCGPVLARFILGTALDQARAWQAERFEFGRMAINVGQFEVDDFHGTSFAERVLNGLSDRNLSPHVLDIEITEAVDFEKTPSSFTQQLRQLIAAGVEISLDDFGTGFASLKHALTIPFTQVKIDRDFISRMRGDPEVRTLIQFLVNWAHALDKRIVAEGVETEDQLRVLQEFGADIAQGYLFGKPLPSQHCKTATSNIIVYF